MDQDDDARRTSVRLTRKFAEVIDGVDLSRNQVGDRLDLPSRDARMLIAEGWASPCEKGCGEVTGVTPDASPATLSDSQGRRTRRGGSS